MIRKRFNGITGICFIFMTIMLGQGAFAQWTTTGNPCTNGTVYAFAKVGDAILAGTELNGVYRSTDNGATWIPSGNTLFAKKTVTSIIVLRDSVGDTVVFAGTIGAGVFRSTDDGVTWAQTRGDNKNGNIVSPGVRCLASIGTVVFAGTCAYGGMIGGGVYRSTDNGTTWRQSNRELYELYSGEYDTSVLSLTAVGTTLIAGTKYGVSVSSDSAKTWQRAYGIPYDSSSYTGEKRMCSVQALYATDSVVYGGFGDYGIFLSTNRGQSWVEADGGLSSPYVNSFVGIGSSVYACAGGTYGCWCRGGGWRPEGLFVTSDYGTSWTNVDSGIIASEIHTVVATDAGLRVGSDYGIYHADNTAECWSFPEKRLPVDAVVKTIASAGTTIFASTSIGIYRSPDKGNSWEACGTGLPDQTVLSLCSDGSHFYAGIYNSGVFKWTPGNADWTPLNTGMPTGTSVVSMAAETDRVFAGTLKNGVYASADGGASWTNASAGLPDSVAIGAITIYFEQVFVGTDSGRVYRSIDAGRNWQELAADKISRKAVTSIVVTDSAIVAASRMDTGGVYLSRDGGATWTVWKKSLLSTSDGSFTGRGYDVRTLLGIGNHVLAGMYGWPVYLNDLQSDDSWESVYDGIPLTSDANSLIRIGDTVFAGLSIRGVWKRALSEMDIPVPSTAVTRERINQRTITMTRQGRNLHFIGVSSESAALLDVFSLTGKHMRFSGRNNGKSLSFDCATLRPGGYVYLLSTENRRLSGQFVMLK